MKDWKDIYTLPLSDSYISEDDGSRSTRIIDANNNLVFQFLNVGVSSQIRALDAINGERTMEGSETRFRHENGYILADGNKAIIMRGWGRLIGGGGYSLSEDEAMNVQDTFAEYIVSKLNER